MRYFTPSDVLTGDYVTGAKRNTMPQETTEQEQDALQKEYFNTSRFTKRRTLSKNSEGNVRKDEPYKGGVVHVCSTTGRPYQEIAGERFYLPDSETKKRFFKFRKETHEAIYQHFYSAQKDYAKDKIILKVFKLMLNPKTGKRNMIDPRILGLPDKYACFLRPNGAIVVTDRKTKRYVKGFHHNCLGPPKGANSGHKKHGSGDDLRMMMINFLTHAMNDDDSRPVIIQAMVKTLGKKPEKLLDLAAKISPKEINTNAGDPAVIVIE